MSRGDRREDIFKDDVDRQDFLKTLSEACQKTRFEVHAYCLMGNHFHLVVETPEANLVAGMRWLLSAYTIRFNHRHNLAGHVFSGRYKALLVEGSSFGYLRTVCDYVHLNPVRAKLLERGGASAKLSVEQSDVVFGDTEISSAVDPGGPAAGRAWDRAFEVGMEARRQPETDDAEWEPVRRGWCLGGEAFRKEMLERMEGELGEHHLGELRRESAEVRAERIIAEELKREGRSEAELGERRKSDPFKLALAARLRRETTLTVG